METTNQPSLLDEVFKNTQVSNFWHDSSPAVRIAIIVAVALLVHVAVKVVRLISEWSINKSHAKKNPFGFVTGQPKFITLTRLIVSAITFVIYFLAVGLVLLAAFPSSDKTLTTYLSSAAVVGLALSFGLQGLVQDVVTGVTLIFSNVMDAGDLVELSGTMPSTVGRVEQIGLRFTKLLNFYNQEVFVPNRNIGNVSRFPRGGIYAYADVQVPAKADAQKVAGIIEGVARGTWAQFAGIILTQPELGKMEATEPGGWNYLRVQFKIWPGQGALIENTFRQQITHAMKTFDPAYADWMVTITYRTTRTSLAESK